MVLIKNKKQIALLLALSTISGIITPTLMNLSNIESFAYSDLNNLSEVEKEVLGIKQIATGSNSTFFLKEDGTVWATGYNAYGQLGLGNTTNQKTMVKVPITNVKEITIKYNHTFFLKEDGTVWACGYNNYGQLGIGNTTDQRTPVQVSISNVKKISSAYNHTLFIKNDGTVWACGANSFGQLGIGNTTTQSTPVQIPITDVKDAVGGDYTVFLKNDGTVWGCGANQVGQLGIGNITHQSTPVQSKITNVVKIECGGNFVYFLKKDGTTWGTGSNNYGQLGTGNTTDQSTPVQSKITNVDKIICGNISTFYLKKDGTFWACGGNGSGQLGIGNTTNKSSPVQISMTNVNTVICGTYHTIFLKNDGTIWGSGSNNYGELSITNTANQPTPVKINDMFFIVESMEDLMLKAEQTKLQSDFDIVKTKLDDLTDSQEKTDLQNRLNKLQVEINNIKTATDLVILVESSKLQSDFDNVLTKVNELPPCNQKTDLQNRLNVLQIEFNNVKTATDLVILVESSKLQSDFDNALTKVNELHPCNQKTDLQNRLNTLQVEVTNIKTATDLVILAENTKSDNDYNKAQEAIKLITDIEIKNSLQSRLDIVKNQIENENLKYNKQLQDATDKISKAESSKTNFDITISQTAINNLKESDKITLQQRLDVLKEQIKTEQETLNYNKLLQEATDKVLKAEHSKIDYDITVAQIAIDKLKTEDKISFQLKIDALKEQKRLEQEALNYNKLLQDAILKVSKAEETKNNYDITIAKDAINKLKPIDKIPLQDRIDILEYNILLEDANLKVLSAEELRTDTSISIAQIAVDKVPLKDIQTFNLEIVETELVGKVQLQSKLDNLKLSLEEERYLKLLQEANDNLTNAESTKSLKDIKLAQMSIDRLKEIDKSPLQLRLDNLKALILQEEKEIQDLKLATSKVEQAEATKTQKDIDDAKILVNSLKESEEKTNLLDRINAVEQIIITDKIKTLIYQADVYVKQAEALKREPYITKAQTAIDKLPACEEEALLQARIDKVKK